MLALCLLLDIFEVLFSRKSLSGMEFSVSAGNVNAHRNSALEVRIEGDGVDGVQGMRRKQNHLQRNPPRQQLLMC